MNTLNALEISLDGSTLIEASAGTGKTYTITTLFLRLLLEKKVSADQILVVTFTIAATEELRLKIAARLSQAIDLLNGEAVGDDTLTQLLDQFDPTEALTILSDVAARLDEVAVYTIDAMCLRVLNSFAFDSDTPLQMEFVANDEHIRRQAAEDYWRRAVGVKDTLISDEILAFVNPPKLLNDLDPLLSAHNAEIVPAHEREEAEALRRSLTRTFFRAADIWEKEAAEITSELSASDALNRNSYRLTTLEVLFKATDAMFAAEKLPDELPGKFDLYTQSILTAKTKKNKTTPQHEFFTVSESLLAEFSAYKVQRRAVALNDAANYIRQRIVDYKARHGLMHFEDLRLRFSAALDSQAGAGLAARVREWWPYALVDEAQDTDPQQNHIFQTIYRQQPDCGLFYIGDPKQAIYAFRGADVFTYMTAAQQMDSAYTLGVNWRSSAAMVEAVNLLFSHSSNPFLFEGNIVYRNVSAAGAADNNPYLVHNQPVPAMHFRYFDNADEVTSPVAAAAMQCAREIATLIEQGRAGLATIGEANIIASDIAVLVKSHAQGKEIQHALSQVGVKSATQGGNTVFSSEEALQLVVILNAIAYPGIDSVRRAMITRVMAEPASIIEQRNDTEDGWDELINRFYDYRTLWFERSFMAAVQMLFKEMQVAERALQVRVALARPTR
ncbi:MAG: UvrD-helicase domain-containing protein, partial [Pseudomonadota bacterium]